MNKRLLIVFCAVMCCSFSSVSSQVSTSYFEAYRATADSVSLVYGIPACVILGVGYHESAGGTSLVATKLNNHFGLAGNCREDVSHQKSRYRYYPTVIDSFNGFCEWVACRTFYQELKGTSNNLNWLQKIRASGYASDVSWANRIHKIIQKHYVD
jgi:flagellum-specific peptidoglycan hydrolase FlgJ